MKHVLGVLMLGLLVGCGSGGGGSPSANLGPTPAQAQTVQYVTVTNDPLRVDLVSGAIPVNVTVDPATLTQSKQVIGLNRICSSDLGGGLASSVTAYTVPQGKTFILTDVIGTGGIWGTISRQVGLTSSDILNFYGNNPPSLHLVSGFDFGPGSQVLWRGLLGVGYPCVSISGYLIPAGTAQ